MANDPQHAETLENLAKELRPYAGDPEIAALEAGAQALRSSQTWQPIETYDDEKHLEVLIGHAVEGWVGEARFHGKDEGWWWVNNDPSDAYGNRVYPTHWMPLPSPPTQRETTDDQGAGLLPADPSAAVTTETLPTVARVIHELEELRLDIHSDMGEAIREKSEPPIAMARLKAYEDVVGLIDVRLTELRKVDLAESGEPDSGPTCEGCNEPATRTTADEVDLCDVCYQSLCDEQSVTGDVGSGKQDANAKPADSPHRSGAPSSSSADSSALPGHGA